MLSYEQVQDILTREADLLPQELFAQLNGGILLSPEEKLHPRSVGDTLYILGEYHYDPVGFGRSIIVYYGSFCRTRGNSPFPEQEKKLREILRHELTHHLEHLAGDFSLEEEDARILVDYSRRHSA